MLKGWRTVALNTLAAVVPLLELTELSDVVPDDWLPWYALTLAVANVWLRALTTTPMGRKE